MCVGNCSTRVVPVDRRDESAVKCYFNYASPYRTSNGGSGYACNNARGISSPSARRRTSSMNYTAVSIAFKCTTVRSSASRWRSDYRIGVGWYRRALILFLNNILHHEFPLHLIMQNLETCRTCVQRPVLLCIRCLK